MEFPCSIHAVGAFLFELRDKVSSMSGKLQAINIPCIAIGIIKRIIYINHIVQNYINTSPRNQKEAYVMAHHQMSLRNQMIWDTILRGTQNLIKSYVQGVNVCGTAN